MKIRLGLALLLSLMTLAACSDKPDKTSESKTTNEPSKIQQTNAAQAEPAKITVDKTEYTVGDSITIGDLELVISRVEYSDGDADNRAADGKFFADVFVYAKNNGEEPINLSPNDFTFYDFNGDESPLAETGYSKELQLIETELAGNNEIKANIIFEIPILTTSGQFKIEYAPDFLDGKITIE